MTIYTKALILAVVSAACFIACGICYDKYIKSKEDRPVLHLLVFLSMMAALATMTVFMWLSLTNLGRYEVF